MDDHMNERPVRSFCEGFNLLQAKQLQQDRSVELRRSHRADMRNKKRGVGRASADSSQIGGNQSFHDLLVSFPILSDSTPDECLANAVRLISEYRHNDETAQQLFRYLEYLCTKVGKRCLTGVTQTLVASIADTIVSSRVSDTVVQGLKLLIEVDFRMDIGYKGMLSTGTLQDFAERLDMSPEVAKHVFQLLANLCVNSSWYKQQLHEIGMAQILADYRACTTHQWSSPDIEAQTHLLMYLAEVEGHNGQTGYAFSMAFDYLALCTEWGISSSEVMSNLMWVLLMGLYASTTTSHKTRSIQLILDEQLVSQVIVPQLVSEGQFGTDLRLSSLNLLALMTEGNRDQVTTMLQQYALDGLFAAGSTELKEELKLVEQALTNIVKTDNLFAQQVLYHAGCSSFIDRFDNNTALMSVQALGQSFLLAKVTCITKHLCEQTRFLANLELSLESRTPEVQLEGLKSVELLCKTAPDSISEGIVDRTEEIYTSKCSDMAKFAGKIVTTYFDGEESEAVSETNYTNYLKSFDIGPGFRH